MVGDGTAIESWERRGKRGREHSPPRIQDSPEESRHGDGALTDARGGDRLVADAAEESPEAVVLPWVSKGKRGTSEAREEIPGGTDHRYASCMSRCFDSPV